MIKSCIVSTTEIDDGEAAVREITGQFASFPLQKNSIGLIMAHPEFINTGTYEKVAKAFSFPIIGMTTISQFAGEAVGTYMLSVTVLTSDDCNFSCGLSEKIPSGDSCGVNDVSRAAYVATRGRLEGDPKLALLYGPFYDNPYLYHCIKAITDASDGAVPLFGAAANDDHNTSLTNTGPRVLLNGEAYDDKFAIVLVSGAIEPKFYIASATEESMVMPRVGVITKAENCRLLEINNAGTVDFLRSAGFPIDENNASGNSGLLSSIFVLHINDGSYGVNVSRIPHSIVDGGIICGGDLVEGAVLSIAFNTREVVLETAKAATDRINAGHCGGTAILHSCLGRRYGLLSEPQAEMELLRKTMGGRFNCTASYANGELCPTGNNGGRADNRFHNQTLIACIF